MSSFDSLLKNARHHLSFPTFRKRASANALLVTPVVQLDDDSPHSLRLGGLVYCRADRRDPPSLAGSAVTVRGQRRPSKKLADANVQYPAAPATADNSLSRIRGLEDQLETARFKEIQQRRRITKLEDQLARERQARPVLETVLKSAMDHFEAKEAELKHTIARLEYDYITLQAEKNEAVRILTAFFGRCGHTPASFSSFSEADTESPHYKACRGALGTNTFRCTYSDAGGSSSVAGVATGSIEVARRLRQDWRC